MPGITWTKEWAGTDDGTIVGGTDLKNIQDDLATVLTTSDLTVADVLTTSDIGVTVQAYAVDKLYLYWENEAVSYENVAVYTT